MDNVTPFFPGSDTFITPAMFERLQAEAAEQLPSDHFGPAVLVPEFEDDERSDFVMIQPRRITERTFQVWRHRPGFLVLSYFARTPERDASATFEHGTFGTLRAAVAGIAQHR